MIQDEGIPPLNDSILVTVRIDPTPPVFQQFVYTASVDEFSGEVGFMWLTSTIAHFMISPPPLSLSLLHF